MSTDLHRAPELPPGEALAALLADPKASCTRDALDFCAGGLTEVVDVTVNFPADFAGGATVSRRLLACTSRDLRQCVLSCWRTRDGAARGLTIVGGIHTLPGPPGVPRFNGCPPGANVAERHGRVDGLPW